MPFKIGDKFGTRTITAVLPKKRFRTKCTCGLEKIVSLTCLYSARQSALEGRGRCKNCVIVKKDWPTRLKKVLDKYREYIGKRFGEWTVLDVKHVEKQPRIRFEMQCSCGNIGITSVYHVLNGNSKSCASCKKGEREWRSPSPVAVSGNILAKVVDKIARPMNTGVDKV